MNIYIQLNQVLGYIEAHIDDTINYQKLANILGCSEYTLTRVFTLLTGYSLNEYIRRRRLTLAAADIMNGMKIIDVAIQYGYSSSISFSRAFKKMYGMNPNQLKSKTNSFLLQPILSFEIPQVENKVISYRIEEKKSFLLYGNYIQILDSENIPSVAEQFWEEAKNSDTFKNAAIRYGVLENKDNESYYWCCLNEKKEFFNILKIPASSWFVFSCNSKAGVDIKEEMNQASSLYIPSIHLHANHKYEIEIYHLDSVELWISID